MPPKCIVYEAETLCFNDGGGEGKFCNFPITS